MADIFMKDVHVSGGQKAQIYIKDWAGNISMHRVTAIGGDAPIQIINSQVQSAFGNIPDELLKEFWENLRKEAKQNNDTITPETVETVTKKTGLARFLSEKNVALASFVAQVIQLLAQAFGGR